MLYNFLNFNNSSFKIIKYLSKFKQIRQLFVNKDNKRLYYK